MSSIFKRTKNLIRANALADDTVAPSIRSVVEMREHLAQKHTEVTNECESLTRKIWDYQTLVGIWQTRLEKSGNLVDLASQMVKKCEANNETASIDYAKAQEMLREFAILNETAKEYVRIYGIALEKSHERRLQQQDTAAKMVETLYKLQSFERKYSLKESLHKASAEITDTSRPELELQEKREINRTLHTAEALLELKEDDYGWNFPALPG